MRDVVPNYIKLPGPRSLFLLDVCLTRSMVISYPSSCTPCAIDPRVEVSSACGGPMQAPHQPTVGRPSVINNRAVTNSILSQLSIIQCSQIIEDALACTRI